MPNTYPNSLRQPFRKSQLVIGAGFRGYYAPFNNTLASANTSSVLGPTILDLTGGPFTATSLAALGFFDTGWIKDFKLTPASKIGSVRSGYRGAIRAQYRGEVGESFELKFREYGRLQYKIATGTNVFNLLANSIATTAGPVSASGSPAVSMVSYSPSGPTLTVASATGLAVGNYIVADIDYNPATFGLVGDAGTPVFKNAVTDVDYIRKNSDYVARITAINGNVLTLDQPFAGGGNGNPTGFVVPQAGSKVQVVTGWTSREGGTFIMNWSAVFLMDTVDLAQIVVYYPHIAIMQNREVTAAWAIENIGTTDLQGHELDTQQVALAFDDPEDGETVVGYKAYYPPANINPGY